MADRPLHPVNRRHFDELRGPFGIWQHAAGTIPDEGFGSCTDDVARALLVDLLHRHVLGWPAVRASAWSSLRFLGDAFDPSICSFRNFRAADGSWLEAFGSQDSQGRAMLALGIVIAEAPEIAMVVEAGRLFRAATPAMGRVIALRATASALLGCCAAWSGGLRGDTEPMIVTLASRLRGAFPRVAVHPDWPWPETTLTYENALLPRAMLVAGTHLGDADLRGTGLRVLDWLITAQATAAGGFSPIGNSGWWSRGGIRTRFDQQPIEATAMVLAAEVALRETGEARYRRAVEAAYGWFLGDNELGVPVADPGRGGCHDGLTPDGVNLNQGAESTLMWLMALEHVRGLRATGA